MSSFSVFSIYKVCITQKKTDTNSVQENQQGFEEKAKQLRLCSRCLSVKKQQNVIWLVTVFRALKCWLVKVFRALTVS